MGGRIGEPSGRRPSRIAVTICASVHAPMPVGWAGVRFRAYDTPHGPCHPSSLPDKSRVVSGAPYSEPGVWQSPQAVTAARYLPPRILSSAVVAPPPPGACLLHALTHAVAPSTAATAKLANQRVHRMGRPPRSVREAGRGMRNEEGKLEFRGAAVKRIQRRRRAIITTRSPSTLNARVSGAFTASSAYIVKR